MFPSPLRSLAFPASLATRAGRDVPALRGRSGLVRRTGVEERVADGAVA